MQVTKSEEEWVTNIRKSIISQLRIAAIRANMDIYDVAHNILKSEKPAFELMEETLMGKCKSE